MRVYGTITSCYIKEVIYAGHPSTVHLLSIGETIFLFSLDIIFQIICTQKFAIVC